MHVVNNTDRRFVLINSNLAQDPLSKQDQTPKQFARSRLRMTDCGRREFKMAFGCLGLSLCFTDDCLRVFFFVEGKPWVICIRSTSVGLRMDLYLKAVLGAGTLNKARANEISVESITNAAGARLCC